MSTGKYDDITHLLNNSRNGIARSFPEISDTFCRQTFMANGFITLMLFNIFEDCIFWYAFEIKFRCGRDFSFDQPDTIVWIMFFNGFTKYQIIDAIWYTIIVSNRGKILVKYIGNILWLWKYTIILLENYFVSTTVGNLLRKKWLYNFEKFLVTILLVTSLSKICLNWFLV